MRRGSRERRLAGEQFVQHAAEAVNVAASIHHVARRLLRTHVRRRADRHAGLREHRVVHGAQRFADAEVGHHGVAVVEHDVLGLHIAVHHTLPVRVVERVRHLAREPQRLVDWKLAFPIESVAKRKSLDVRHDIVHQAIRFSGVEQREDVRMRQLGSELDLAKEALSADGLGDVRPQHLERNVPVMANVVREVDGCHTTGTQLSLDHVASRKGSVEQSGCVHRQGEVVPQVPQYTGTRKVRAPSGKSRFDRCPRSIRDRSRFTMVPSLRR